MSTRAMLKDVVSCWFRIFLLMLAGLVLILTTIHVSILNRAYSQLFWGILCGAILAAITGFVTLYITFMSTSDGKEIEETKS